MAHITVKQEHVDANPAFAPHLGKALELGKFRSIERQAPASASKTETVNLTPKKKAPARKAAARKTSKKAAKK
jgi:hypothetical protein